MTKKQDKILLIAFLIIIFIVFINYPIMITKELLGKTSKVDNGTWQTYDSDASIFEKLKINIENRTTNYFPFYTGITSFYRNTEEKLNEKIYKLFSKPYIPAGTNSDGEYLIKDLTNNSYYAISNLTDEELEIKLSTQIAFFNDLKKASGDIPVSIYLPSRLEFQKNINEDLPYRNLSNYEERFINELNKEINVRELIVDSKEEYNKLFYKSDHHWNMYGAYRGYLDIMSMLGKSDIQEININEESINFTGSFSRTTRNSNVYDKFYTVSNYNKNYTVKVNGEEPPSNFKPLSLENLNKKNIDFYDWYVGYFYGLYGNVVYDFKNTDKKNLLIISDSYAWQIDYLIASSYNKTHVINLMYDEYVKKPLDYKKYIEENDIDEVLILQESITTIFDAFEHDFYGKVEF